MKDGQSVEEGQAIANDLMTKLDIQESDLISGAYMDLILKNKQPR
jgi:adenylate cyclase class IV